MDILAGAFGGDVSVWQTVIASHEATDVSGALELALVRYEKEQDDARSPSGASVYVAEGSYAVVLMFGELSANG